MIWLLGAGLVVLALALGGRRATGMSDLELVHAIEAAVRRGDMDEANRLRQIAFARGLRSGE